MSFSREELTQKIADRKANLDGKIAEVNAELKSAIDAVEEKMREELKAEKKKLRAKFAPMRKQVRATLDAEIKTLEQAIKSMDALESLGNACPSGKPESECCGKFDDCADNKEQAVNTTPAMSAAAASQATTS